MNSWIPTFFLSALFGELVVCGLTRNVLSQHRTPGMKYKPLMWGLRGPQEQSTWVSEGVLELSTHPLEQGESSNMSQFFLIPSFSRARDPQELTSEADLQESCRSSLQTAGVWRLSLLTLKSFHLYLVSDAIT